MCNFFQEQATELESRLREAETPTAGLPEIYECIELAKGTLRRITSFIRDHPFTERVDEIHYFKVVAPPLYGRLFYYLKRYEIGIERVHSSNEQYEARVQQELARIDQFYARHWDFHRYYLLEETYMDDRIFIRNASENSMLDPVEVFMAEDFCVGCYWAAQVWANQELRVFLDRQVRELRGPAGSEGSEALDNSDELQWTDSATDLVEVAVGFFEKRSFNHGKATLKQIAQWVSKHWHIDLGNYYNTWQEIVRRKKSKTKYFDETRAVLLKKIDDAI